MSRFPRCHGCGFALALDNPHPPQWGRRWCGNWLCWWRIARNVWEERDYGKWAANQQRKWGNHQ